MEAFMTAMETSWSLWLNELRNVDIACSPGRDVPCAPGVGINTRGMAQLRGQTRGIRRACDPRGDLLDCRAEAEPGHANDNG